MAAVSALVLGVSLEPSAYPADLTLYLALTAALFPIARSRSWYLVLVLLLSGMLHLGNAAKIAILGGPLMPDDVSSLRSLALILEGKWLLVGVTLAAAMGVAGWRGLTLRPRAGRRAAAALAGSVACLALVPGQISGAMDDLFGNSVWDQNGNYRSRGPTVHLIQETARHLARRSAPPDLATTLESAERLTQLAGPSVMLRPAALSAAKPRRNVHMIVLESFWDARLLEALGLSDDPFDPRFRALWREGEQSRALGPVFGGYTANAEFEALCGFPVERDLVIFEAGLARKVPCLPGWLSARGYTAAASHPNIAAFWNRTNAYRRIGFDIYWSASAFDMDDMNGEFLSDRSLYRQVLRHTAALLESGEPVFNYILTFFGHLDYPLNASRPPVIGLGQGDERAHRYVNTVRYKSAELMDLLAELRVRDPDALVIVFGDHLPFLGNNFGTYADAGLLAGSRGEFTPAMHRLSVATPLVIIDGRRGVVPVGDVPLYRLPSLVRDLLGLDDPIIADLSRPPQSLVVRPLPGFHLVIEPNGGERVCRDGDARDAACALTEDWLRNLRVVGRDILAGRQFALRHGVLERVAGSAPPAL